MRRLALRNAFSGVTQVVVNIGLLLLTVPLFISRLGLPTYGIYALITAIGSVGVFTNFGFNTTLIKYLAEQRNRQESNYDIVVTLIIISGSTLLVALLSLVFSDFVLLSLLNLSSELITSSVRGFYIACVGANVFNVISLVPSAVLDAQQRVYITNGVQLGIGVLSKGLILASLVIVPSLALVGWIMLGSSFVGMCLLGWFGIRTWGEVSCPALRTRFFPVAKKHFTYGRDVYATVVVGFFYEPVTKVLMSHYVGLNEVGFFDIALRIKGLVWGVLERLLYPVLPMFASRSSIEEVRTLIEEVQHKLIVIVVPLLVATVFLTGPIVSVWLSTSLWPVVVSIVCVVNCYLLTMLFVPLYHFLTVKGYPHKTLVLQSVNVGVNVLLFACLAPWFGYYGALCAFCLAVLTSTVLCAWYQWSILRSKPIASWDFGLRILKLGGCLVMVNIIPTFLIQESWLSIWVLMTVNGVATILLFRWLKLVSANDVERYIGRTNRVGMTLEKLLVQGI